MKLLTNQPTVTFRGRKIDLSFILLELYTVLFLLGTQVFNTVMLVLFAVLLAATLLLNCYPRFALNEFSKWIGLLAAFSFLSVLWAGDKGEAYTTATTIFKCALLGFVVSVQCDSDEKILKLLYCFCFGVLLMDIYCIIVLGPANLMSFGQFGIRISRADTGFNANYIAGANTPGAILALFLIDITKKKRMFLVLAVYLVVLALAASRASFVELAFGFLLYVVFVRGNHKLFRAMLALLIAAVVGYILYESGLLNTVLRRFGKTGAAVSAFFGGNEGEGDIRLRLIAFGLEKFAESPLFGYGCGQYRVLALPEFGTAWEPHNTYIESMVGFGVCGLVLWQGMYVRLLYGIFKKKLQRNPVGYVLLAYLLSRLVMDIFGYSMTTKYIYLFLALGFAFLRNHASDKEPTGTEEAAAPAEQRTENV